jgi:guanylate kinase
MREGKLVILSAPSGAGKTTIVKHLLKNMPSLLFSVSATSREPRKGEQEGVDYYFLSVDAFTAKIRANEFVEYENVYPGLFYGTLHSEVNRIWELGKDVAIDMDVMGGMHLKEIFGARALSIFIHPPSIEVLEERLRKRGTETEEKIAMRLAKANKEIESAVHFDVVILNDVLEVAIDQVVSKVNEFLSK